MADAIEYEDDPFCWDLVVDKLKLCVSDHLGVVRCTKDKYYFSFEDDPFRAVNLKGRALAITAYTQILDLLAEGLPAPLGAYGDETLILQGRGYVFASLLPFNTLLVIP